jgi:hypothetical protein
MISSGINPLLVSVNKSTFKKLFETVSPFKISIVANIP